MRLKNIIYLLSLLLTLGLAGCETKESREQIRLVKMAMNKEAVIPFLPAGYKNLQQLDHSWFSFELDVAGKTRVFLLGYERVNAGDGTLDTVAIITELSD